MTVTPLSRHAQLRAALKREGARWGTFVLALLGAAGVVQYYRPPATIGLAPFAAAKRTALPRAEPALNAFGKSGAVQMRFALPGEAVHYPLQVRENPSELLYAWVRLTDGTSADSARALTGAPRAPQEPGFYQLALEKGGLRRVLRGVTVAVLIPFDEKRGSDIEGYRIGTFLAERLGSGEKEHPAGFVKITESDAQLPITKHLRLGDFLTRDGQTQWPRYAAISPLVLDKLELVVASIAELRGGDTRVRVELNVHSAFRTPAYNGYNRFSRDSRHQYGDAIDVAIDANGDGKLSASDTKLVAQAVDRVEQQHPELMGGMGVYTSEKYNQPYVHIDARGKKARWRG
ncbi:MAG: hypothetical protein H0W30_04710 [Gemmatimonadaceae bacterium]|nr:hypothetical protein [Gemmatimonadaceae bacterium]